MRYWREKYGVGAILGATVVALILFRMQATKVGRTGRAIDAVRRLGGSACRSDVCFEDGIPHGALKPVKPPGWPTRCAQALGADWVFDVVHVDFRGNFQDNCVADEDLALLAEFPNLLDLDLCDTGVTDEGLKHLAGLRRLRRLDLRRTRVTDEGLRHIVGLKELQFLNVEGTKVTRRGIEWLKRAIPAVETSPIVGGQMADWDDLSDEVDEFTQPRHSAGTEGRQGDTTNTHGMGEKR